MFIARILLLKRLNSSQTPTFFSILYSIIHLQQQREVIFKLWDSSINYWVVNNLSNSLMERSRNVPLHIILWSTKASN